MQNSKGDSLSSFQDVPVSNIRKISGPYKLLPYKRTYLMLAEVGHLLEQPQSFIRIAEIII